MTRKIFSILLSIFVVISGLFIILLKNYMVTYSSEVQNQEIKYHLQVYVQNNEGYITTELKKGALEAAEKNNAYVEFVSYEVDDVEMLQQLVDQSVYSEVDGVALKIFELESGENIIEKLLDSDITVSVYDSEYYTESIKENTDNLIMSNIYTTGINSHNMGFLAGELVLDSSDGNTTAAIIANMSNEQDGSIYVSNIVLGIQDAFSKYDNASCKIETVYNQKDNPSEYIVDAILNEYPDIDTIICFDQKATPAITQALVDSNKIDEISVIGYGMLPQTLKYIQRGVICGTICPDSEAIGYDAVEALVKMLDGETVSDTGYKQAFAVTINNVDDYIEE